MIANLLHPELRNPQHKDFKKSYILAIAYVITVFFLVLRILYYANQPNGLNFTWHNFENIVGLIVMLFGYCFIKFKPSINTSIAIVFCYAMPSTLYSVTQTGGIYSHEISYYFILITTSFVFINTKWGLFFTSVVIFIMVYLLLYHSKNILLLPADQLSRVLDASKHATTWIFLFALTGLITFGFKQSYDIQAKVIADLKMQKIEELEQALHLKTKEINELTKTLAQDFHDNIGNKLAAISAISETLYVSQNEKTPQLFSINKLSKEIYSGTKDFIWTMNLDNNNLQQLYFYLIEFGAELFQNTSIDFLAQETTPELETIKLSQKQTSQIVLIVKEAMTNVLKHAAASQLNLKLNVINTKAMLTITDNGKGFNAFNLKRISGTENMKLRAEKIGAEFQLISEMGNGCTMALTF
jgi:signal transduction histidine kinase